MNRARSSPPDAPNDLSVSAKLSRARIGSAIGRLLGLVATLLAASAIIFLMTHILPGDAAELLLGMNADPEAIAALRQEMGLDAPLAERFLAWLGAVMRGDLGLSWTYEIPVAQLIAERAAVSVPLALLAVILSVAVALPIAIYAAANRGRAVDRTAMAGAQLLLSVPNVWLGLMLILLFAVTLGWLPAGGFPGWDAGLGAALGALVMPAIALAAPQTAILARLARTALVETMDQDFVALAQAKGLSRAQAVWRHALPAALSPIITIIGLQFGFLLAGAIIIETVFSLPGLGRLLFQAVGQRDFPVVEGVVLVVVFAVVLVNGLCDMLGLLADPRVKQRSAPWSD